MTTGAIEDRLIVLLEAERAGVFVARALLRETTDAAGRDLMAVILDGERDSCRVLGRALLALGSRGNDRVGDFVQKVMSLEDPVARLNLLIKGQQWVVRKIDEAMEMAPRSDISEPLAEIRHIHEVNIRQCIEYVHTRE